ncbi:MAG: tyrosine--tRNA ligase, partial [Candidatus Colwellbacteria bacterium]|nr:tyrosine--tRNA ligase [Candidatus Colwellbacteria bacterium]
MKDILTRGVAEIINRNHLEKALKSRKKLRVKLGIDPTAPDLHLGHAVVLRKLKQFQNLGHKIVLIIGDFTATIGDPAGRIEARKPLSPQEVKRNEKTYLKEAGKIINIKKAEIRHNSEWFLKEGISAVLALAKAGTIQQVLHRADFKKRLDEGKDITLLETMYPLFQGYDSVKIKADVELGGTDQLFNVLMGRKIQRYFGLPEQDVLTVPLLEGTDGVKKMSKSFGNYIALDDPPAEMFGKLMSIKDNLIIKYFELCTDVPEKRIAEIKKLLKAKKLNPRDAKIILAFEIVSLYRGSAAARDAKASWENIFSRREFPKKLPVIKVALNTTPTQLVYQLGVAKSRSEASRLVEQGALKIDNQRIKSTKATLELFKGQTAEIQIGKRNFFRA